MSGSVKRDDVSGTWGFVTDGPPKPDGKRNQIRRRGFNTKKEAQQALAKVINDQATGTFVRPTKVTVRQFLLEEWLPAKEGTLRPSTSASYRQTINNYVLPRLGGVQLSKVDGAMLNTLYGELLANGRVETRRKQGPGLSPKTVRNTHGVLTKAFQDAVRWGRIVRNPCSVADPPAVRTPEMKAWTSQQLAQFVAATRDHRWAAIWTLLATTGLRRGEVLGLRWSDVDLTKGTVTVRATRIRYGTTVAASVPKTARGNRTVTLGPDTLAALKAWRSRQNADRLRMGASWPTTDLVVTLADGSAPNPEAFSNLFKKLSKAAGLPVIRLHDIRHTYATSALATGTGLKVLSQRLGHADVGVTMKVYAHVMPGDDEDAAVRADQVLRAGGAFPATS